MVYADTKAPKYKWDAIGADKGDDGEIDFMGNFDGQGHYISGLYNCSLGGDYGAENSQIGLFAKTNEATISNLTIKNSYFYVYNAAQGVAALIAEDYNSVIKNCHVTDTKIYAHSASTAGLIGHCIGSANIVNCSVSGEIKSGHSSYVAGIVASVGDGVLDNCVNKANIIGVENAVPGSICGYVYDSVSKDVNDTDENAQLLDYQSNNFGQTILQNCVNDGDISCEAETGPTGGIVATVSSKNSSVTISNCKNTAQISGCNRIGGVVGMTTSENDDAVNYDTVGNLVIKNCENKGLLSGKELIGGIVGTASVSNSAYTKITQCRNDGAISGSDVGGILASVISADNSKLHIDSCVNNGELLDSTSYAGGVVGLYSTTDTSNSGYEFRITNCANNGKITVIGDNTKIGGILAWSTSIGGDKDVISISDCINSADINFTSAKSSYVAGVVGWMASNTSETKMVVNSKNTGNIVANISEYDGEWSKEYKICVGEVVAIAQDDVKIENCSMSGEFTVETGDQTHVLYDDNLCGLIVSE